MKLFNFVFYICIFYSSVIYAGNKIVLNNISYNVPVIIDFIYLDDKKGDILKDISESSNPADELLAIYVPISELANTFRIPYSKFISFSVPRENNYVNLSQNEWNTLKEKLINNIQKNPDKHKIFNIKELEELNLQLEKRGGGGGVGKMELTYKGCLEGENYVSVVAFTFTESIDNNVSHVNKACMVLTWLNIDGTVINLKVSNDIKNDTDLQWCMKQTQEISTAVALLNKIQPNSELN